MSRNRILFLFILAVLGTGMVIGLLNRPGEWYQQLAKPGFHPPNWIFSPVWTVLYILIGIVGWRVWTASGDATLKLLWIAQMGLNFCWSPVFFGLQNIRGALVLILALLMTILLFIGYGWKRDRPSAMIFLPYLAWAGFAMLLNGSIDRLN